MRNMETQISGNESAISKIVRRQWNPDSKERVSYVCNPSPYYTPTEKHFKSTRLEDVDAKWQESLEKLESLQAKAKQINLSVRKRTKLHYGIRKMLSHLDNGNIFMNPLLIKAIGHRRGIHTHRKMAIEALLRGLIVCHDVLSGLVKQGCITTLSDQCGLTTYGKKRDDEYAVENPAPDDVRGLKKSVSRASRALRQLEEWGLIEITRPVDKVTGKYLPAIVKVTEKLYRVLGVSEQYIKDMLKNKLEWAKMSEKSGIPADLTLDELEQYQKSQHQRLIEERSRYATLKRQKRMLANMTHAEIKEKAAYDVRNHTSAEALAKMSDDRYMHFVNQRCKFLYRMKKNPAIEDTFFSEMLGNYATGSLH